MTLRAYMTLISHGVCKIVFMDRLPREELMYKLPRVGLILSPLLWINEHQRMMNAVKERKLEDFFFTSIQFCVCVIQVLGIKSTKTKSTKTAERSK